MSYCNCPHEVRAGCTDPNCPHYMPRMKRVKAEDGREYVLPVDAILEPNIKIEFYPCAKCGTAVETHWSDRGMLRGDNVLVADWVFHPSCWEGMLRENPPNAAVR